jgi:integrase/recombinase XerD
VGQSWLARDRHAPRDYALPCGAPGESNGPGHRGKRINTVEELRMAAYGHMDGAPAERLAGLWLARYGETTRAAYASDLCDFAAFCASLDVPGVLDVRADHINAYIAELNGRGLSTATVARRLSALSSFYEHARREGAIHYSPVDGAERPRLDRAARRATPSLNRRELAAFVEAAAATGPRDHALAALLCLNGLRVSEVCRADAADVAILDRHSVLEVVQVNDGRAVMPLAEKTAAAVATYLGQRQSGPLLFDNSGRERLDRHDVARVVRRLAKAAGVAGRVTPQSLRYGFAGTALELGASARDLRPVSVEHVNGSLDAHPVHAIAAAIIAEIPGSLQRFPVERTGAAGHDEMARVA